MELPRRSHAWGAILGCLCALGIFELVARAVYFVPLAMDPQFGPIVKADTRVVYRREGSGTSHWIDHGVRRAHAVGPKDEAILVLGDSFTEALMIDDADVYTHRLERALVAEGHAVAIVNAGKSAASTADYVGYADRYLTTFRPRWTIVQITDDDVTTDAWVPTKPHFERTAEGLRVPVSPPGGAPWGAFRRALWRMRQRSALLNYALVRLREYGYAASQEAPLFYAQAAAVPPPAPASTAPIGDVVSKLVESYGGRITLLYLAQFDPRHPSTPTAVESEVQRQCRDAGLSCVDIRSAFPAFSRDFRSPYGFANSTYNAGHLNAAGHAVAADLLSAELSRLIANGLL